MSHSSDPADGILARLDNQEEFCGSEPPRELVDEHGRIWKPGDCWCTRPPHHDGDCLCEVCHARHGAPGWPTPKTEETWTNG